jgi:hypothetical protein
MAIAPCAANVVASPISPGDVRRHYGSALKRHPADNCAWAWRDLPLPDQRAVLLGAARGTGQPKVVAFLDKHLPGVCLT